ncbi:hypothetical protein FPOAC2_14205 [Fusarium poae]
MLFHHAVISSITKPRPSKTPVDKCRSIYVDLPDVPLIWPYVLPLGLIGRRHQVVDEAAPKYEPDNGLDVERYAEKTVSIPYIDMANVGITLFLKHSQMHLANSIVLLELPWSWFGLGRRTRVVGSALTPLAALSSASCTTKSEVQLYGLHNQALSILVLLRREMQNCLPIPQESHGAVKDLNHWRSG